MAVNQRLYVDLVANVGGFQGPMRAATADVGRLDASTQKAGNSLFTLGNAAKGGALLVAAALGQGVHEAIAFDKAMRNVQSVTKQSDASLAALGDQAVGLSTKLPQSATTLAEGLYDIASSGFSGADGLKVLEAAAVSASAGVTDTAVSAKAISAVLNAYALEAGEAADVSDQLFQTVNLGVTTFEQLAHNVGDYLGQAKALKVDFAETQSAIATLTLTGTHAAQAGTVLGSVLNSLIRPQEGLAEALKAGGYETGQAAIEALGLRGTLMMLSDQTGGTAAGMGELFTDTTALRGVLGLTSNEGAKYAEVAGQIEDKSARAGAAQKALAEQSKSVSYQLTIARNRAQAVTLEFGRWALPQIAGGLGMLYDGLGNVVDVAEVLTPFLQSMWGHLGNLVDIGGDLLRILGPVGEGFALLAGAPVVAALTAMGYSLEAVSGFLADNEWAVALLATALGAKLLPVLILNAQAAGAIVKYQLATWASSATGAMSGLGATAGAAATGLAAAGAAGALLYAAGTMWSGYRDAVDGATTALEAYNDAIKADDISAQITATEGLSTELERMQGRLDAIDKLQRDGYGISGIVQGLREAGEEVGLRRNLEQVAVESQNAELELQRLQGSVVSYLAATSGMEGAALVEHFGTAEASARQFRDVLPTLIDAGVQVGDSYSVVTDKLNAYRESQSLGAAAAPALGEALGGVGEQALNLEDAVSALSDALDRLFGVFLSQEEATDGWHQSLADLGGVLAEVDANGARLGSTIEGQSQRARDNREAIRGSVEALLERIEADARAGVSGGELIATLEQGREALIRQGEEQGVTREKMVALLDTYKLTPENIATVVQALGIPEAGAAITGVQEKANTLDRSRPTPHISIAGADAAITKLSAIDTLMGNLSGKTATPRVNDPMLPQGLTGDGPGAPTGGNTLARVLPVLNRIGGVVTSTYRSPAANRAAGGSPTSYHMDKENPAVDIGGPTGVLDRLAATLRAMGGWRELLWRVRGHYDHVHVAEDGLLLGGEALGGLAMRDRQRNGLERHEAGVHQAGALRLFAEPETGGEAYIPLGMQKRNRSTALLSDVAGRFGYQLVPAYASGAVVGQRPAGSRGSSAGTAVQLAAPAGPSTLVVVDADGQLVGRMRVEAQVADDHRDARLTTSLRKHR